MYIRNSFMDPTQEQSLNGYLTKIWQISPLVKELKSQTKRSHALHFDDQSSFVYPL